MENQDNYKSFGKKIIRILNINKIPNAAEASNLTYLRFYGVLMIMFAAIFFKKSLSFWPFVRSFFFFLKFRGGDETF